MSSNCDDVASKANNIDETEEEREARLEWEAILEAERQFLEEQEAESRRTGRSTEKKKIQQPNMIHFEFDPNEHVYSHHDPQNDRNNGTSVDVPNTTSVSPPEPIIAEETEEEREARLEWEAILEAERVFLEEQEAESRRTGRPTEKKTLSHPNILHFEFDPNEHLHHNNNHNNNNNHNHNESGNHRSEKNDSTTFSDEKTSEQNCPIISDLNKCQRCNHNNNSLSNEDIFNDITSNSEYETAISVLKHYCLPQDDPYFAIPAFLLAKNDNEWVSACNVILIEFIFALRLTSGFVIDSTGYQRLLSKRQLEYYIQTCSSLWLVGNPRNFLDVKINPLLTKYKKSAEKLEFPNYLNHLCRYALQYYRLDLVYELQLAHIAFVPIDVWFDIAPLHSDWVLGHSSLHSFNTFEPILHEIQETRLDEWINMVFEPNEAKGWAKHDDDKHSLKKLIKSALLPDPSKQIALYLPPKYSNTFPICKKSLFVLQYLPAVISNIFKYIVTDETHPQFSHHEILLKIITDWLSKYESRLSINDLSILQTGHVDNQWGLQFLEKWNQSVKFSNRFHYFLLNLSDERNAWGSSINLEEINVVEYENIDMTKKRISFWYYNQSNQATLGLVDDNVVNNDFIVDQDMNEVLNLGQKIEKMIFQIDLKKCQTDNNNQIPPQGFVPLLLNHYKTLIKPELYLTKPLPDDHTSHILSASPAKCNFYQHFFGKKNPPDNNHNNNQGDQGDQNDQNDEKNQNGTSPTLSVIPTNFNIFLNISPIIFIYASFIFFRRSALRYQISIMKTFWTYLETQLKNFSWATKMAIYIRSFSTNTLINLLSTLINPKLQLPIRHFIDDSYSHIHGVTYLQIHTPGLGDEYQDERFKTNNDSLNIINNNSQKTNKFGPIWIEKLCTRSKNFMLSHHYRQNLFELEMSLITPPEWLSESNTIVVLSVTQADMPTLPNWIWGSIYKGIKIESGASVCPEKRFTREEWDNLPDHLKKVDPTQKLISPVWAISNQQQVPPKSSNQINGKKNPFPSRFFIQKHVTEETQAQKIASRVYISSKIDPHFPLRLLMDGLPNIYQDEGITPLNTGYNHGFSCYKIDDNTWSDSKTIIASFNFPSVLIDILLPAYPNQFLTPLPYPNRVKTGESGYLSSHNPFAQNQQGAKGNFKSVSAETLPLESLHTIICYTPSGIPLYHQSNQDDTPSLYHFILKERANVNVYSPENDVGNAFLQMVLELYNHMSTLSSQHDVMVFNHTSPFEKYIIQSRLDKSAVRPKKGGEKSSNQTARNGQTPRNDQNDTQKTKISPKMSESDFVSTTPSRHEGFHTTVNIVDSHGYFGTMSAFKINESVSDQGLFNEIRRYLLLTTLSPADAISAHSDLDLPNYNTHIPVYSRKHYNTTFCQRYLNTALGDGNFGTYLQLLAWSLADPLAQTEQLSYGRVDTTLRVENSFSNAISVFMQTNRKDSTRSPTLYNPKWQIDRQEANSIYTNIDRNLFISPTQMFDEQIQNKLGWDLLKRFPPKAAFRHVCDPNTLGRDFSTKSDYTVSNYQLISKRTDTQLVNLAIRSYYESNLNPVNYLSIFKQVPMENILHFFNVALNLQTHSEDFFGNKGKPRTRKTLDEPQTFQHFFGPVMHSRQKLSPEFHVSTFRDVLLSYRLHPVLNYIIFDTLSFLKHFCAIILPESTFNEIFSQNPLIKNPLYQSHYYPYSRPCDITLLSGKLSPSPREINPVSKVGGKNQINKSALISEVLHSKNSIFSPLDGVLTSADYFNKVKQISHGGIILTPPSEVYGPRFEARFNGYRDEKIVGEQPMNQNKDSSFQPSIYHNAYNKTKTDGWLNYLSPLDLGGDDINNSTLKLLFSSQNYTNEHNNNNNPQNPPKNAQKNSGLILHRDFSKLLLNPLTLSPFPPITTEIKYQATSSIPHLDTTHFFNTSHTISPQELNYLSENHPKNSKSPNIFSHSLQHLSRYPDIDNWNDITLKFKHYDVSSLNLSDDIGRSFYYMLPKLSEKILNPTVFTLNSGNSSKPLDGDAGGCEKIEKIEKIQIPHFFGQISSLHISPHILTYLKLSSTLGFNSKFISSTSAYPHVFDAARPAGIRIDDKYMDLINHEATTVVEDQKTHKDPLQKDSKHNNNNNNNNNNNPMNIKSFENSFLFDMNEFSRSYDSPISQINHNSAVSEATPHGSLDSLTFPSHFGLHGYRSMYYPTSSPDSPVDVSVYINLKEIGIDLALKGQVEPNQFGVTFPTAANVSTSRSRVQPSLRPVVFTGSSLFMMDQFTVNSILFGRRLMGEVNKIVEDVDLEFQQDGELKDLLAPSLIQKIQDSIFRPKPALLGQIKFFQESLPNYADACGFTEAVEWIRGLKTVGQNSIPQKDLIELYYNTFEGLSTPETDLSLNYDSTAKMYLEMENSIPKIPFQVTDFLGSLEHYRHFWSYIFSRHEIVLTQSTIMRLIGYISYQLPLQHEFLVKLLQNESTFDQNEKTLPIPSLIEKSSNQYIDQDTRYFLNPITDQSLINMSMITLPQEMIQFYQKTAISHHSVTNNNHVTNSPTNPIGAICNPYELIPNPSTQAQVIINTIKGYQFILPPLLPNNFSQTLVSGLLKIAYGALQRVVHTYKTFSLSMKLMKPPSGQSGKTKEEVGWSGSINSGHRNDKSKTEPVNASHTINLCELYILWLFYGPLIYRELVEKITKIQGGFFGNMSKNEERNICSEEINQIYLEHKQYQISQPNSIQIFSPNELFWLSKYTHKTWSNCPLISPTDILPISSTYFNPSMKHLNQNALWDLLMTDYGDYLIIQSQILTELWAITFVKTLSKHYTSNISNIGYLNSSYVSMPFETFLTAVFTSFDKVITFSEEYYRGDTENKNGGKNNEKMYSLLTAPNVVDTIALIDETILPYDQTVFNDYYTFVVNQYEDDTAQDEGQMIETNDEEEDNPDDKEENSGDQGGKDPQNFDTKTNRTTTPIPTFSTKGEFTIPMGLLYWYIDSTTTPSIDDVELLLNGFAIEKVENGPDNNTQNNAAQNSSSQDIQNSNSTYEQRHYTKGQMVQVLSGAAGLSQYIDENDLSAPSSPLNSPFELPTIISNPKIELDGFHYGSVTYTPLETLSRTHKSFPYRVSTKTSPAQTAAIIFPSTARYAKSRSLPAPPVSTPTPLHLAPKLSPVSSYTAISVFSSSYYSPIIIPYDHISGNEDGMYSFQTTRGLHTLMKAILRRASGRILVALFNSIADSRISIPQWRLYSTKPKMVTTQYHKENEPEISESNIQTWFFQETTQDFFTIEINFLHLLLIADTQSYAPEFVQMMQQLFIDHSSK